MITYRPDKLDSKRAAEFLFLANLPILYEQTLQKDEGLAHKLVMDELQGAGLEGQIIRNKNTTALVVFAPQSNSISVAFSASDEKEDIADNMNYAGRAHALGGVVHSGFDDAVNRVKTPVIDAITEYAKKSPEPVKLNVTGFSQGGSAAIIFTSNLLANNFQEQNPNLKIGSVHTFGSPPAGDKEFIESFQGAAMKSGVNLTSVVLDGAPVPDLLTKRGPWYIPEMYQQLSRVFYIDPDNNTRTKAPDKEKPDWKNHDNHLYLEKIGGAQRMAMAQSLASFTSFSFDPIFEKIGNISEGFNGIAVRPSDKTTALSNQHELDNEAMRKKEGTSQSQIIKDAGIQTPNIR